MSMKNYWEACCDGCGTLDHWPGTKAEAKRHLKINGWIFGKGGEVWCDTSCQRHTLPKENTEPTDGRR